MAGRSFRCLLERKLPIWLEAKSMDEAQIDRVIDFLCSAQITSPIIYQQAYRKIKTGDYSSTRNIIMNSLCSTQNHWITFTQY